MIQIDKGIPIPPPTRRGTRPIYPWREMDIGDSFLMPCERDRDTVARAWVSAAGSRTGRKFRTSRVEGGIRVWRTA